MTDTTDTTPAEAAATPAPDAIEGCERCLANNRDGADFHGWTPGAYARLVAETGFGHDTLAHQLYARLLHAGIERGWQVADLTDDAVLDLRNMGTASLARIRTRFPKPADEEGLRAAILEALNTAPAAFIRDDAEYAAGHIQGPWWRHDRHQNHGGCALCRGEAGTLADAVMAALEDAALEQYADVLADRARIRNMEIRAGSFHLGMAQTEELAAAYVALARTLLGDAENYAETPIDLPAKKVEFTAKVAESPESFLLTVQRTGPGRLTPHEARERAEAELTRLRGAISALTARFTQAAHERPDQGYGAFWTQAADMLTELTAQGGRDE